MRYLSVVFVVVAVIAIWFVERKADREMIAIRGQRIALQNRLLDARQNLLDSQNRLLEARRNYIVSLEAARRVCPVCSTVDRDRHDEAERRFIEAQTVLQGDVDAMAAALIAETARFLEGRR